MSAVIKAATCPEGHHLQGVVMAGTPDEHKDFPLYVDDPAILLQFIALRLVCPWGCGALTFDIAFGETEG